MTLEYAIKSLPHRILDALTGSAERWVEKKIAAIKEKLDGAVVAMPTVSSRPVR